MSGLAFFTLPNPEITQESSVDPMGIQIIWTHLGQEVFHNKLTTIATDLRVYTFNVFHHHLIRRLLLEHPEWSSLPNKQFPHWKSEFDIKAGLLMFLEDLVTHVFYRSEDQNLDKIGILGLSKVRGLYNEADNDLNRITLSADKNAGILTNQLNLGMSGRYKGPMIEMKFFNRRFEYGPANLPAWKQVDDFIEGWKDIQDLEENLLILIQEKLGNSRKGTVSLEEIGLSRENGKKVSQLYLQIFGKRKLPKEVRNFWKDKLGLNAGAPKRLFEEVLKAGENAISYENIVRNAIANLETEPGEAQKLRKILDIEPFLTYAEYLFRYLAQPGVTRIHDVKEDLQKIREWLRRNSHFEWDESIPRLDQLRTVLVSEKGLESWVDSILTYHNKIMQARGASAWVELQEGGKLRHYYSTRMNESIRAPERFHRDPGWWHSYYLDTLHSLAQDLK